MNGVNLIKLTGNIDNPLLGDMVRFWRSKVEVTPGSSMCWLGRQSLSSSLYIYIYLYCVYLLICIFILIFVIKV